MNQDNSRVVQDGLISINKHFGFLSEQGYEVSSSSGYVTGWPVLEVVWRKGDFFIRLYGERGAVDKLSFRKLPDDFVDIEVIVYALTGKIYTWNFLWGFSGKGYANLLQKYLNQIETYFGKEYIQNKDALISAQNEYRKALARKENRSAVPSTVVAILLFAGALTPVYMLLLRELFSFSSMDDFHKFVPVVSFLLAMSTMLIIQRRIKNG